MEQLGPFPLALRQEADDIDADYGDSLQVQGGTWTADLQLVRDLLEVLGLHGPEQPNARLRPIRAALDLERHPSSPFHRTRSRSFFASPVSIIAPIGQQSPGHPSCSGECLGPAGCPSSNCPASAKQSRRQTCATASKRIMQRE